MDESKDLRREKDRIEADEYVFMYGASRREGERERNREGERERELAREWRFIVARASTQLISVCVRRGGMQIRGEILPE